MKMRMLPSSEDIATEAVHGFFTRRANRRGLAGGHVRPFGEGQDGKDGVSIGSPSNSRLDDPAGRYSIDGNDDLVHNYRGFGLLSETMMRHCQPRARR